jgi:hypothetical protein
MRPFRAADQAEEIGLRSGSSTRHTVGSRRFAHARSGFRIRRSRPGKIRAMPSQKQNQ